MRARWPGSVAAAAAVSMLFGCTSAPEETGQSVAAISGGVSDSTHTNVLGILIHAGGGFGTCTGSLIAPNLVLTARHCVSPVRGEGIVCQRFTDSSGTVYEPTLAEPVYSAGSFQVTTSPTIGRNSRYTAVAEVLVPAGSTGSTLCGKDIALLRLASPITDVGLVEPRLDLRVNIGETFTAVGYGATNGFGGGSGERRMRDGLSVEFVGMYSQNRIMVLAESELLADTGTCQGDSGGPALDVGGAVFGVLSRGGANTCDTPIYTRVDSYADWIRTQTRNAINRIGAEAPAWLAPPEPGSAGFNAPCRGDDECAGLLACGFVGTERRCLELDCEQCPAGFVCGDTSLGVGCVPDPNATTPDAGMPDPPDAGTTPDGGTEMPPQRGGCTTAPVGSAPGGFAAAALAAALALVTRRRR